METLKVTSKYSNLYCFKNLHECEEFCKSLPKGFIIQFGFHEDYILIETVNLADLEKYRNETKLVDKNEEKVKTKQEQDLENALDTVLNKDPFGDVYSGWKLKDIMENDPEWIDKAIKDLKNTFIKDKLILIKNNYK